MLMCDRHCVKSATDSTLFLPYNYPVKSVQFSRSVVPDSLGPHESARQASLSITNSRSSLKLTSIESVTHPAISSSVVPFSCPQSLPASKSFPMSQLFAWGGQSTGVSALASFLPKNTQGWSPSEWTDWISLQSKGLSRVFSKWIPLTPLDRWGNKRLTELVTGGAEIWSQHVSLAIAWLSITVTLEEK